MKENFKALYIYNKFNYLVYIFLNCKIFYIFSAKNK